ncbi:MAG: hypothetical protein U0K87_13040 [Ruminococcus sp.]|nr:hypothetical protein [Ruminococcus sp.]
MKLKLYIKKAALFDKENSLAEIITAVVAVLLIKFLSLKIEKS